MPGRRRCLCRCWSDTRGVAGLAGQGHVRDGDEPPGAGRGGDYRSGRQGLREHLGIGDDYAIGFVTGRRELAVHHGANDLCLPGKHVDVLHTGTWTAKALGELKKGVLHNVAASTEVTNSRVCRGRTKSSSRPIPPTYICARTTPSGYAVAHHA